MGWPLAAAEQIRLTAVISGLLTGAGMLSDPEMQLA
jgi:hypothetical protein